MGIIMQVPLGAYLLRVQKAINLTEKAFAPQDEYSEGWYEVGSDLSYGISLGSDHAVMQQIVIWSKDDWLSEEAGKENSDRGYADRMKEIHKLIEEMS